MPSHYSHPSSAAPRPRFPVVRRRPPMPPAPTPQRCRRAPRPPTPPSAAPPLPRSLLPPHRAVMSKPMDQQPSDMQVDSSSAVKEKPTIRFSINVLELMREAQMQHGLRQSDYTRYWRYCSARLRRLYRSLKFLHGRGKYTKRNITESTVTDVRTEGVCSIKKDSRTSLEAEAYASYTKGALYFEQEKKIDAAMINFKKMR